MNKIALDRKEILKLQKQLHFTLQEKQSFQTELDLILYERLNNRKLLENELRHNSESIGLLQQELHQIKKQNKLLEEQLIHSHLVPQQMHKQIEQLQLELEEAKSEKDSTYQLLAEANKTTHAVSEHQEKIALLLGQIAEHENEIKMVQHHFAKKVKENALLKEQLEYREAETREMHSHCDKYQARIVELTQLSDLRQEQEKKVQQMLNETIKSLELQVSRWEEKYCHLSEKWQELERRNHELRKIEESQKQLQELLVKVGAVLAPSDTLNRGAETRLDQENLDHRFGGSNLYLKKS